MAASERAWRTGLLERLGPREVLDRGEAYARFWAPLGVSAAEVGAVLDLLELEYGIPGGAFRPDDSLDVLLTPVSARGWLAGIVNEVRAGDREVELAAFLRQQCRARGEAAPADLRTLGDYVRACAGVRAS